VVGSLERVEATRDLFNVAVLLGPKGVQATYRKIHLPYLGVDRFTTPGDQPFAVQDLGGLRVGMNICYDGGFPEAARCLMLLGADLVVLAAEGGETILYADIDPESARRKHLVHVPGRYELHRTAHRRPEMYGELIKPVTERFVPRQEERS
jgi:predicted amidohydrolase